MVRLAQLTIDTPRLTLRPLREGDVEPMCRLLGDAEALAHWGDPLDREGVRRWIERNQARYEADGFGRCAIVLRATGELVGDAGLIRTDVEGRQEVELGWIVAREHQGTGVATEAAQAWLDHAFGSLGLDRIVSMISADNVASRRVAEKLGMHVERSAVWGSEPMLMYVFERQPATPAAQARARSSSPSCSGPSASSTR